MPLIHGPFEDIQDPNHSRRDGGKFLRVRSKKGDVGKGLEDKP
jgi:hypothetical protein